MEDDNLPATKGDLRAHAQSDALFQESSLKKDAEIGDTLVDIKDNHLAHLQAYYEQMSNDLGWIKWLVMGEIAGVGAIIVGFLINILTKLYGA